jgi:hypothetical protein
VDSWRGERLQRGGIFLPKNGRFVVLHLRAALSLGCGSNLVDVIEEIMTKMQPFIMVRRTKCGCESCRLQALGLFQQNFCGELLPVSGDDGLEFLGRLCPKTVFICSLEADMTGFRDLLRGVEV